MFQVAFKEELIAELKFIFSFSGDVKTVRHRDSSGRGSGMLYECNFRRFCNIQELVYSRAL